MSMTFARSTTRSAFRVFAILFASLALFGSALAGQEKPYDQATFDSLTKAGKPVVVWVHASWCPTCRAQYPIIDKAIKTDAALKDATLLVVDFDDDKPVLKAFGVRTQSTVIVFKAGKEVGRSIGDTREPSLTALLHQAS